MKIALVCSHGGHLTEMLCLMNAFEGHEVFFITYESTRTDDLRFKKYILKNIGTNFFQMIVAFIKFLKILLIERPQLIVSTGSEIAIPAFYIAKLRGIKTVYIESWCRVSTPSSTGKIVYYVSDLFLIQWPQLLGRYGKKARFEGAVV
jgi:UDP-N-acetylglucosamine:LPS N-acetylglucosamine transferase